MGHYVMMEPDYALGEMVWEVYSDDELAPVDSGSFDIPASEDSLEYDLSLSLAASWWTMTTALDSPYDEDDTYYRAGVLPANGGRG